MIYLFLVAGPIATGAAPDESSREVEVASSSAGEREQDMPVETSLAHNREHELETEENFFI